ncbi:VWA domain-containing protein [Candidatus Spyradosoma sp. SGI.093]|uniref:VWA domain-containing protein n=1 Tax=Candidatus Spyradosoma sp. SGI.093 TaxID=3420583 RepID=UPI003CFC9AFA
MNFFLHPERLYHLLWIVPALTALYALAEARRRRALRAILGAPHFSAPDGVPVGTDVSRGKRFARFLLLLACAALTTAAWARPSWGETVVPFRGAGRDVVVALDLSKSMLCEDVRPSRLAHARRFAALLAERMRGDRLGLVPFAGDAFLACPLTFDRASFRAILDDQEIGSIPLGGTNLEAALKTAAGAFETAENLGHCAIVLVTDGGELSGSVAREAAKLRAAKLPVVVVGVGDPSAAAPIPLRDADGNVSYLKDSGGNTVTVRLEEKPLAELAAETGGVYVRSAATEMGDETAAAWLRRLTPGAAEENVHAVPIERREWFLVPALVALLLYLISGETRSAKGLRASAFALLLRAPKTPAFFALALLLAGTRDAGARDEDAPVPAETAAADASAETLCADALRAQEAGEIARSRELYREALARPGISPRLREAVTQNLGAGFHAEARNETASAAEAARSGPDAALEKVSAAEKNFARAKALYRDLLRAGNAKNAEAAAGNFRLLLNDEQRLAELKKQLEELKKRQEEAARNAREAAEKQRRANEEKRDENRSDARRDENGKDAGKRGAGTDSEAQREADAARERAAESARALEDAAKNLGDEKRENAARRAAEKTEDARREREAGNGGKAEESLDEAAKILEDAAAKNSENDGNGSDGGDGEKDGGQKGGNADAAPRNASEKNAENADGNAGAEAGEGRELDAGAAEAVLRDMEKDETERRRAILRNGRGKARSAEKDW